MLIADFVICFSSCTGVCNAGFIFDIGAKEITKTCDETTGMWNEIEDFQDCVRKLLLLLVMMMLLFIYDLSSILKSQSNPFLEVGGG